ncbi:hypothetical protein [Paraburkholderia humisilvae]|uniref:hypothetical protein n=1 Tax=Paraburkholderia humisilvae TaxID=627669 RepID=UPI00158429AE|nr:hypothetical protein [Paraburkholderia humisilvae]
MGLVPPPGAAELFHVESITTELPNPPPEIDVVYPTPATDVAPTRFRTTGPAAICQYIGSLPEQFANLKPDVAPGTGTVILEMTVPTETLTGAEILTGNFTETAPRLVVDEQPALAFRAWH